jgi:hypothetical protein
MRQNFIINKSGCFQRFQPFFDLFQFVAHARLYIKTLAEFSNEMSKVSYAHRGSFLAFVGRFMKSVI